MNKKHDSIAWGTILREANLVLDRQAESRWQVRNPVMFCVYVGSILTTLIAIRAMSGQGSESISFVAGVSMWLWFTVLFANFAEAIAEGQGKAQAESMRRSRTTVQAYKLDSVPEHLTNNSFNTQRSDAATADPLADLATTEVSAPQLKLDDTILVRAGQVIPADGEVIAGVASVDESAITGEKRARGA